MDDATWARIEAKRESNRYFRELDRAARRAGERSQRRDVAPPKPRRKRAPRQHTRPIGPQPKPAARPYAPKPRGDWKSIPGRPVTRPDACVKCDRPFRPRKAKIADHPGTVYHVGKGLCRQCGKGE